MVATTVISSFESSPRRSINWSKVFGTRGQRLVGVALLIVVWEVSSAAGWLNAQTLAGPGTVVSTGWDLINDGELPADLWISLQRVLLGLLIGVAIGLTLALLAGLSRTGEAIVDGPMQIFRMLPILALQPLFVLWFGIGEEMKILLIAFAVEFPVYINTYAGIRGVDRRFVELAHGVRLNNRQFIRRVVLPGALPNFLVGLRYAAAISWLVLILSEEVNATSGIGYLVSEAGLDGQTNIIVVCLAVYGTLGFATDLVVRLLEHSILTWRRGLEAA